MDIKSHSDVLEIVISHNTLIEITQYVRCEVVCYPGRGKSILNREKASMNWRKVRYHISCRSHYRFCSATFVLHGI